MFIIFNLVGSAIGFRWNTFLFILKPFGRYWFLLLGILNRYVEWIIGFHLIRAKKRRRLVLLWHNFDSRQSRLTPLFHVLLRPFFTSWKGPFTKRIVWHERIFTVQVNILIWSLSLLLFQNDLPQVISTARPTVCYFILVVIVTIWNILLLRSFIFLEELMSYRLYRVCNWPLTF